MSSAETDSWPELPYRAWQETCTTLHLWAQIVGKVRLARTPWLNHSWHATLYVTARGLTTSPIPHGRRSFQIDFDFIDHVLVIATSDGAERRTALEPRTVADFHAAVMGALAELNLPVEIHDRPSEVPDPVRFRDDDAHRAYDAEYAQRFWRVLVQVDRVFKEFRTGFLGKVSPVHLFWGALDLAVTRFSGRLAPPHPGGIPHLPDAITREAYSHEVSSAGFWAGGGPVDQAMFYSYAYPSPAAFRSSAVEPPAAWYHEQLGEFVLPYDAVRSATAPEQLLLAFLDSTYRAAADTGNWDRAALECAIGQPGVVRTH
jgi:hypothetical protein